MQNPSPTPNPPKTPAFTRLFRWLFSWSTLRRALVCLAALITLLAVVWTVENWRGKRAWEKYQREWEAKGEKFDLQAFIPPPVPDDQNFTMTPFLAPLLDFNPLPLKPGQSLWRDTNAFQKLQEFGYKESPNVSGSWTRAHRTDLTAWADALDGKKDVPASGESSSDRALAATNVLRSLEKYKPVLDELRTASQRPFCRFNVRYDGDPADILLPHLSAVKKISLVFQMRALAELGSGQNSQALEDTEMILYLAASIKGEPTLISGLVRIAMLNISLQPVWEGLAARQWSDAQLKELQQHLAQIDLLTEFGSTMRGERALGNVRLDYWLERKNFGSPGVDDASGARFIPFPSGWIYQNKLFINRMYQHVLQPLDGTLHRAYSADSKEKDALFHKELFSGFVLYKIFARLLLPAMEGAGMKFAYAQANIDEAVVACALERYRLAHGQFPESLDALSPQFIEKIPHDLITGEPLKYNRTEDGQFVLYSVGWNGKDDGGKVALTGGKHGRVDISQGDWVWQYPAR